MLKIISVPKTLFLFSLVFLFVSTSPIPQDYDPALNDDLPPNPFSDGALTSDDYRSPDETSEIPEKNSYDGGLTGEVDSEYDEPKYTYPPDNSLGEELNQTDDATNNMEYKDDMEENDMLAQGNDTAEMEDALIGNDTIPEENKNDDNDEYINVVAPDMNGDVTYSDYSEPPPSEPDVPVNGFENVTLPADTMDMNVTTSEVVPEDTQPSLYDDGYILEEVLDDDAATPKEDPNYDTASEEAKDDQDDILPTEAITFGGELPEPEFNSTLEWLSKEDNNTETDTEVNQDVQAPIESESLVNTDPLQTVDAPAPESVEDDVKEIDEPVWSWEPLDSVNSTQIREELLADNIPVTETSINNDDNVSLDDESLNGDLEMPANNGTEAFTTSDAVTIGGYDTANGVDNYEEVDYATKSETQKDDYSSESDGPDGVFYNNGADKDQTESLYDENIYDAKNKTPEDGLYDADESPADADSYKDEEYATYEDRNNTDDPYNSEDTNGMGQDYTDKEDLGYESFANNEDNDGKTEYNNEAYGADNQYKTYPDSNNENDEYKPEDQYSENNEDPTNYDNGEEKADEDDDKYLYKNDKETAYKNEDEEYYNNDMINNGEEYPDQDEGKSNTYENNYDNSEDTKTQYGEFNSIHTQDDTYKSNIIYEDGRNFDEEGRDFEEDEEELTDFTNVLFVACGAAVLFLILYCGGWVLCTRSVLKTLEKTQRLVTGRSKFGDGYKLLPNSNAKRA